jgi:hypothetical protein
VRRTLIWLAVQAVCRGAASHTPVTLFGIVDYSLSEQARDERFAAAA